MIFDRCVFGDKISVCVVSMVAVMLCRESIDILLNENGRVNSWAKYVWVRLVASDALEQISSVSGVELCKWYGVPKNEASGVLGALEGVGVLERILLSSSGRGRPAQRYRLVREALPQVPNVHWGGVHGEGVFHLLRYELFAHSDSSDKRPSDLAQANAARLGNNSLSIVDRLLLAILLCHSDEFGFVVELGFAEIAAAVCISSRGVKSRLEKFTESGIISWRVHGVSSPILTRRMKGACLLDLKHTCFGGGYRGRVLKIALDCVNSYPKGAHVGVFKNFKEELLRIANYIDWKVGEYAAYLVNECVERIEEMSKKDSSKCVDITREVICSDFKLGRVKGMAKCDEAELENIYRALMDDLNWISFRLALRVIERISNEGFFKGGERFKIRVIPYGRRGLAVRGYFIALVRGVY